MPKITEALPVVAALVASAALIASCGDQEVRNIPAPAPVEHFIKGKERNNQISAIAARFARMILKREGSSDKSPLGSTFTECYGPANPKTGEVKSVAQSNTKSGDSCKITAARDTDEWAYAIFNTDATGNYDPKNISGFLATNYAGCTAEFNDEPEDGSNTLAWNVTDWDLDHLGGGGFPPGRPASIYFSKTVSEAYNVDQAAFACMRATELVVDLEQRH
jgi:hypothetical protein